MLRPDRARQLVAVAEQTIAERGFQAVSMEEIAERAGVTKPVLYDHFGSKDGLLAAVVARAGHDLETRVVAAVRTASGAEDALARGLRAYFTFVAEHAPAWSVLLTEAAASAAAASAVEAIRAEQAELIAGLIAAELSRDRSRSTPYANALVGACERLALGARAGPPVDASELTATVMDVMWIGFDRLRGGERWTGWAKETPGTEN